MILRILCVFFNDGKGQKVILSKSHFVIFNRIFPIGVLYIYIINIYSTY